MYDHGPYRVRYQNAKVSRKMRRTVFPTDAVEGGDVVECVILNKYG